MANFPFYKKPLLSGPSAKTIRPAVSSVKKFRHFRRSRKRFRLRGLQPSPQCHIQHHHAEAPRKNTVPTLECCPCDISGISSSTTTYSMAPAKRSRTFVHLVPSCGFNALLRYCRGLCPVAFAKRVEKLLASPKPTFCAISPTLWSVRTSSSFACVMRKLTR